MASKRRDGFGLRWRLLLIACLAVCAGVSGAAVASTFFERPWLVWSVGVLVGVILAGALVTTLSRHLLQSLGALEQGLLNLLDKEFSTTLAESRVAEVNELIRHYNRLTLALRQERQSLYQRELLLDTVIENSALCVLTLDERQRVIYANHVAEALLRQGQPVQGLALGEVLRSVHAELRLAIERLGTGVFPVNSESQELYHVSCGQFVLNSQRHTLILMKEMTRELNRQEAATWKKVFRVISHEINNSLAPISSLAHSGQLLVERGQWQPLPEVFAALSERADHLRTFVSRYGEIAKLPMPRKTPVDWQAFYQGLTLGCPFKLQEYLPSEPGFFDAAQVQQLLLNLLKNASESGSPSDAITLRVRQDRHHTVIEVADRGSGMPAEVMKHALLPFYSTKRGGSGVGLPLCREIAEAHGGTLSLRNRRSGGLRVRVCLPLS